MCKSWREGTTRNCYGNEIRNQHCWKEGIQFFLTIFTLLFLSESCPICLLIFQIIHFLENVRNLHFHAKNPKKPCCLNDNNNILWPKISLLTDRQEEPPPSLDFFLYTASKRKHWVRLNSFSCFCSRKGLISFLFTVSVSYTYTMHMDHIHPIIVYHSLTLADPLYPPSPVCCVRACVYKTFSVPWLYFPPG